MRIAALLVFALIAGAASAQQPTSLAAREAAPVDMTPERLEQLVAPIALYSDDLLAQVLMASTYPLEIVEAARWRKKNASLQGAKLEAALKGQDWDTSVKSICGLTAVLDRMDQNLDWTQDLGDAFLSDKAKLMDAVQHMRRKAFEAGQLKSSDEQKVTDQEDKIIVVEQTSQEVVYVPTYYPSVVYGSWTYPYWYYPPMYVPPPPGAPWYGFAAGVIWGAAIWGGCHWGWGNSDIDIDVDHHYDFDNKVNRDAAKNRIEQRSGTRQNWQHDAAHRRGVNYRDSQVAQRYGATAGTTRVTRDQARGYGDRAATRPATGDAARTRPSTQPSTRPSTQPSTRPSTRPSTPARTNAKSTTFTGSRSSNIERASSTRGATSRSSSARSTGATRSSGAMRSSGAVRSSGGMRGGGGGGRGGGGRR